MIAEASARLAACSRARFALAAGLLLAVALLAVSPGPLAPVAARAALGAGGLFAAAALLRRRARPAPVPTLQVIARAPLPGGAGLALVEVSGRRLLVGFGGGGVRLVSAVEEPAPGALP